MIGSSKTKDTIISLFSNYVTCGPEQRLTKGVVSRVASSHHLFLIVNTVYIVLPMYQIIIPFYPHTLCSIASHISPDLSLT